MKHLCLQVKTSSSFWNQNFKNVFVFFFLMVMTLQLEEKLTMSERNREKHQAEIKAKQRRREEKAKRVRNKAKQIQEGDDVVGLAVDHDETYNADEEGKSTGPSCIKGR